MDRKASIKILDQNNKIVELKSDKTLEQIKSDYMNFENQMKQIFESDFVKNNFRK